MIKSIATIRDWLDGEPIDLEIVVREYTLRRVTLKDSVGTELIIRPHGVKVNRAISIAYEAGFLTLKYHEMTREREEEAVVGEKVDG